MPVQALEKWLETNNPGDGVLSFWDQIHFVRQAIPQLITSDPKMSEEIAETIWVIGTHQAGEHTYPVYEMNHPSGKMSFVIRYNFMNWIISAEFTEPISADFKDLFDLKMKLIPIFCEGFPRERVYDSYSKNHSKFTLRLRNEHEVYIFFWLVGAALNLRLPKTK